MNRKTELATQMIEQIAEDDSHGYSQVNRWGPDYDCSSLVITVWQMSGVPVKGLGATYTGNMYFAFINAGFVDVTSKINLRTGSGLERGDVLLNVACHTAMYVGDGKIAHARSSEGNSIEGDGNGREIVTGQAYFNYPWDYVLRYEGDDSSTDLVIVDDNGTPMALPADTKFSYLHLQHGSGLNNPIDSVKILQMLLGLHGFSTAIDGEFGNDTEKQVKRFQIWRGLDQSGIVDQDDWEALIQFTT